MTMEQSTIFPKDTQPAPSIPSTLGTKPQFQHDLNSNIDCKFKGETPARISLACMTCRSRKVRCNGKSPCSSCFASNRACVFDQTKPKRRRKANSIGNQPLELSPRLLPATSPSKIISFQPHSVSLDPHTKYFPLPATNTLETEPLRHEMKESVHNTPLKSGALVDASHSISSAPECSQIQSSSSQPTRRIPYFRFLGPTAIAPGAPFREISMKLVREQGTKKVSQFDRVHMIQSEKPPGFSNPKCYPSPTSLPHTNPDLSFALSESEFCRQVEIYYSHMGSFISSINKEDLLHSLSERKASEALKLAISALAECIQPSSTTVDHAEIRSQRAKSLVVPHLSLPSLDTTFTLLLIAYCEFARDKDSGLWMWSGLAFRMATDLGLHKSIGPGPSKEKITWDESESDLRERIFWSCYHLDRLISSGTGRVTTFLDSEIEIGLPPVVFIPLKTSSFASGDALLAPFHYLTRILALLGKISDTFNRSKLNEISTRERHADTLQAFRVELHEFHASLPPILHFTVDNARRYIEVKHGQAFLLIHLWFHTLVIITHTPSVGASWNSLDIGPILDPLMHEWSRGSVRTISDMLAFGNLFDPDIYLSVPFASQPIMIAACASIPTQPSPVSPPTSYNHASPQTPNPSTRPSDRRDLDICALALQSMQVRWRGVSWLISTLNSRASYEMDVDLSTSGGAEVSTCDSSLMNKLIERSNEVLNLGTFEAPGPHFVGLTASGTFHEPASGRLSLLHQSKSYEPSSNPAPPISELGWSNTTHSVAHPSIQSSCFSSSAQVLSSALHRPACASSILVTESEPRESISDLEYISADPNNATQKSHLSSSWVADPIPQINSTGVTEFSIDFPLQISKDASTRSIDQSHVGSQSVSTSSPTDPYSSTPLFCESMSQDTPLVPKEVLEELFRGEVGVWQSFRNL